MDPKLSVFPYDPTKVTEDQVRFYIRTASPSQMFAWTSSDHHPGDHHPELGGQGHGLHPGQAEVQAAMNRAAHIHGSARIMVTPATDLRVVTSALLEVEIGQEIQIPVAFFSKNRQTFTKCDRLNYRMTVDDPLKAVCVVDK